jgi:hypothetical protein
MKLVTNEKLIKRNVKIGQYTALGGLVVIGIAIYYAIQFFVDPGSISEKTNYVLIGVMLLGFILAQVSMYYGNRWGRKPRLDERITSALKGLTYEYTLYHYMTPVPHVLIGPAGIWALTAFYQRGQITYENGRWKQKASGLGYNYMRIFGQENLGRPDLEAKAEAERLRRYLAKLLPDQELPPVQALAVFTDEQADVQVNDAPIPALPLKRLKEFLRKQAKDKPLAKADIERIQAVLPKG